MFSGHSIKRGSVQLYRSLGIRDESVMEIIQMKGHHAYSNYTAAYSDCVPVDLPRFANVRDFINHADTVAKETDWVHDPQAFQDFLENVGADPRAPSG